MIRTRELQDDGVSTKSDSIYRNANESTELICVLFILSLGG